LNGGEHVAVLLLLDGDSSMEVFSRIQAEYVTRTHKHMLNAN
jgi:hypothetical protein